MSNSLHLPKLLLLLSFFVLPFTSSKVSAQYCNTGFFTSGCAAFGDFMQSFSTTGGSTNITNNGTGCGAGSYTFYSTMTHTASVGQTVNWSITNGNDCEWYTIFVDWNQNFILDNTGEVMYASTACIPASGVVTGSFLVPSGALPGTTRMRVRCNYGSSGAPCTQSTWGEVEDYNFTVTASAPCTNPPPAGTAVATPNPVCPNIAFSLTATGASLGSGMAYQWQSAPSATGPWTNITGATNLNYTVTAGITVATSYRLQSICSGGTPVFSTPVTVAVNTPIICMCIPISTNGCSFDYINSVSTTGGSINISNLNTGCTGTGYTDYSATKMHQGVVNTNVNFSVTTAGDFEAFKIWVDWNQNGIFETTENVHSSIVNAPNTVITGSFLIPPGATVGTTRMRVRCNYNTTTIDPCLTQAWGECEDYGFIVQGPPPLPGISSNSPVCSGANIVLNATNTMLGVTFNWTGPNSFTATGATVTIPNAQAANAGTYSVTASLNSFTSAAATTAVVVTPPIAISLGTLTVPTNCLGATDGSIQINGLAASTAYTINYTRNLVAQPAVNFTSTTTGSYTLSNLTAANYASLVVTNNTTGCASIALGPVSLSPTPPATPTAIYNAPLCIGSNLSINVTNSVANGIYNWTGPNSFVATGPNITRNNLTPADAGNYNVTVTVAGCISNNAVIPVVVNPTPAAPTTTGVTYCQDDVATPLTAVGQNLKWYTAPTGGSQLPGPPTPNTDTAGTYTWYVSQSVNTCEGPRSALTVLVNPTPPMPTGNTEVSNCQYNTPVQLVVSGANLRWYTTPTGGTASTVAPTPATLVPGTYTWYVTQTVLGCQSPRLAVVVTIIPKPAPPTVTTPIVYCQYQKPSQLTAFGQNLKWYTAAIGGQGSTLAPTPNGDYEDTTSWWVTQTINGCESDRSLIEVMVYQTPNGIILFEDPNQTFVCQYDSANFIYFGNARPEAIIDWKVPAKKAILHQLSPTMINVKFDSFGTIPIRMQVNYHGCVSKEFILNVPVRPVPIVRIATKPEICLGDTSLVAVDFATPGISNFAWNFAGGTEIFGNTSGGGPYGVTWPGAGTYNISVRATANECTSPAYTAKVVVHPLPDGRIKQIENKSLCSGDSIQLFAVQEQDSTFSYIWTPIQFFNNGKGAGTFADNAWAIPTRKEQIHLQVYSYFGCMSQDSVLLDVKPCCDVYLPDAFTPNGDGKNDLFRVISEGHHKISNFRVLNRLGHTVFETADESRGWDGSMGGRPQDPGVYFYYIRYQCVDKKFYEMKGDVTLIR